MVLGFVRELCKDLRRFWGVGVGFGDFAVKALGNSLHKGKYAAGLGIWLVPKRFSVVLGSLLKGFANHKGEFARSQISYT